MYRCCFDTLTLLPGLRKYFKSQKNWKGTTIDWYQLTQECFWTSRLNCRYENSKHHLKVTIYQNMSKHFNLISFLPISQFTLPKNTFFPRWTAAARRTAVRPVPSNWAASNSCWVGSWLLLRCAREKWPGFAVRPSSPMASRGCHRCLPMRPCGLPWSWTLPKLRALWSLSHLVETKPKTEDVVIFGVFFAASVWVAKIWEKLGLLRDQLQPNWSCRG